MGVYFALRQHSSIKEMTADLLITLLANMGGDPNSDSHFHGSTGKNVWDVDEHLESQPAQAACRNLQG